ncbi:WD repeat-containing protein 43-like isoform X2 [Ptychodera flava]|uniref:WD repeat-containing protein 43-like isoform X2 n=1 Tax=Ptychodera flava TaxID=63121 RepID=UPI00396A7A97
MAASPCVISPDGEYLAFASPDGRLKVWETETGVVKQQYTPSSHLSATCSCLAWGPPRESLGMPRKKKRKSEKADSDGVGATVENLDLIALGTSVGSILLYSVVKGDLQTKMDGGHDDTINCLCWHSQNDSLYSCSDDRHIVEWSIATGKVKCKWKADKRSINSICLCPDGRHILSAGRTIKLWDLEKKEMLKRYTGHASPVSQLICIPLQLKRKSSRLSRAKEIFDIDGMYFLSSAIHDRVLNAWQVKLQSKDKKAVAAFSLIEEPLSFSVARPSESEQITYIAVVTRNGQLLIFDPVLNGKTKTSLEARCLIQIATPGGKEAVPKPIPILSAQFCNDADGNILLSYGTFLKPVFEKVHLINGENEICLIREDPSISQQNQSTSVNKVKTPLTSDKMKLLTPQNFVAMGPSQSDDIERRGKKKRKGDITERSMEDRLIAMSIACQDIMSGLPQADSLVKLLTQGLRNQDDDILSKVLRHGNETLLKNTVKLLPVQLVLPFAEQLSRRINQNAERSVLLIRWVKAVLTLHTSYLSNFPELTKKLSTLYQMIDTRTQNYANLSRLQGKLSLVVSQISAQAEEASNKELNTRPVMVFQDV